MRPRIGFPPKKISITFLINPVTETLEEKNGQLLTRPRLNENKCRGRKANIHSYLEAPESIVSLIE